MNVREQRAPPARGGAISDIFGTTFFVTSPRFINGSRLQANRFDARLELGVGVERVARFVAGAAEIGGADHDHRHAVVDAGHRHAVERVDDVAGRQQ